MRMLLPLVCLATAICVAPARANEPHLCAAAAAEQGLKLLQFHSEAGDSAIVGAENVTYIGKVKALKGKGKFDVLDVPGSIYKADYRMRMIYAIIGGQCILMGQEVFEASDPY